MNACGVVSCYSTVLINNLFIYFLGASLIVINFLICLLSLYFLYMHYVATLEMMKVINLTETCVFI